MSDWNDKTTNQILLDIEQLKMKHESLKSQMLKLYDEMEHVEKEFLEANKVVHARLKGVKDV